MTSSGSNSQFHNSRLGYTLTVINTPSFTVDHSPEDTVLVHQVVHSLIRNGKEEEEANRDQSVVKDLFNRNTAR